MTLQQHWQEQLFYSQRLKSVEQRARIVGKLVCRKALSESWIRFQRDINMPFLKLIEYILQNNENLHQSALNSSQEIHYTSEEFFDALQELPKEQQKKVLDCIKTQRYSIWDDLHNCVEGHDKSAFISILQKEECNLSLANRILAFYQVWDLHIPTAHVNPISLSDLNLLSELMCDIYSKTINIPLSSQSLEKELTHIKAMLKELEQDIENMDENAPIEDWIYDDLTLRYKIYAKLMFKVKPITFDKNKDPEEEKKRTICIFVSPYIKFYQKLINFQYRNDIQMLIGLEEQLKLVEREMLENILRQAPMNQRYEQIRKELKKDAPFTLPNNVFGRKMNPIHGLDSGRIIKRGVENYVAFINELAEGGYIGNDNYTKLAFARDFLGLSLSPQEDSPIKKVKWEGNKKNNEFYYLIGELHQNGSNGYYVSARTRFVLNENDKEKGEEKSYAKNVLKAFKELVNVYYPSEKIM